MSSKILCEIFNQKEIICIYNIYKNEDDLEKIEKCIHMVAEFFLEHNIQNKIKTSLWFHTNNPILADFTPSHFILLGKVNKVFSFISSQLN